MIAAALALLSAAAIPPPLPPPDTVEFHVGNWEFRCRLPDPAGPLVGCVASDVRPWVYVSFEPLADGAVAYRVNAICLPGSDAPRSEQRYGRLGDAGIDDAAFTRDLAALWALGTRPDCQAQYLQPPLDNAYRRDMRTALVLLRSLR